MVDLKELARGSIGAYLRYITAVAVDGLPTTSERAKKLECEMNVARDAMFNGIADAQAEIARLRGALEACSDALAIAAPFADGCPSEDAIKIIVGQTCARAALK